MEKKIACENFDEMRRRANLQFSAFAGYATRPSRLAANGHKYIGPRYSAWDELQIASPREKVYLDCQLPTYTRSSIIYIRWIANYPEH